MLFGTQDKDFFPADFHEKFRVMKEMGFDCFETDGKVLVEHTDELIRASRDTGMVISSACGGYRGWIGDFIEERRLNGIEDLKEILKRISEAGGTGVVVPAAWGMFTYRLPPMVSPRSKEGDRRAILDSLLQLDPVAQENDVWIYLEPLNRYQDHMLNTLADAKSILDEGGFSRVKLTFDTYHMNIEEDHMLASLKEYAPYIGHVHIAENHRYQPGTGSIDWEGLVRTLREISYEGAVVNEGRVRGEDPFKVYGESAAFMRSVLDRRG